jgi:glycosyltransferase involved in cell wall biosynthesis
VTDAPLRIALTSYRSKPHCGGQGVYVRQLSRALVGLGHSVEVFSGPPYPDLDEGVALTRVPSLDLYREPDPFRIPKPSEFRDRNDLLEFLVMCTAGFPEPRTFSRRVVPLLRDRAAEFDVVHDNQTLAPALLELPAAGLPLLSTIHHPISVDRAIGLASAPLRKKLSLWRWYGFVRTQARVARAVPLSVTPSQNSATDAVRDFGVRPEQLVTIPLGVDVEQFRPRGPRVPGRLLALCSADVPLKGLAVLLRSVAAMPPTSDAQLTVVTEPAEGGPTEKLIAELGIGHRVRFVFGLGPTELAELMASAEIVVVPSLYEGFSLPAVEAMASGTPLVASDTGALPEVVGRDGRCGVLVPPGDPSTLATTLTALLDDCPRREAMGEAARQRALEKFSWPVTAQSTVDVYRRVIAMHQQTGRNASVAPAPRHARHRTTAC